MILSLIDMDEWMEEHKDPQQQPIVASCEVCGEDFYSVDEVIDDYGRNICWDCWTRELRERDEDEE